MMVGLFCNADARENELIAETEQLMKYLYSYQMLMSLFISISKTELGVSYLVKHGLLESLQSCEFIQQQPSASHETDGI
jgi:hypothetical protein